MNTKYSTLNSTGFSIFFGRKIFVVNIRSESSDTPLPWNRRLQLPLTDGYREIVGLEIARVPDFDSRSARVPGTKVLLLGDDILIRVCDGFALLCGSA